MNGPDLWDQKRMLVGQVFTPGAPVNEKALFAGRIDQLNRIIDALSQSGYHCALYGERGVGKTSLANILVTHLQQFGYLIARATCDAGDTFSSVWRKAVSEITYSETQASAGFIPQTMTSQQRLVDTLPDVVNPDDIRRLLQRLSASNQLLVILDEYDRLADRQVATLVSDSIKSLSDSAVRASILLIGVAASVDELIEGHRSIERNLVQIPMPRMSQDEIRQIFDTGLSRLGMGIEDAARQHLISLSQGLPYIAHLLALYSVRAALDTKVLVVERSHVDTGISAALQQWQESIKSGYYDSVKSQQPGNIYREVMLACAMASVDEKGFFAAAAVRTPLRNIVGRDVDIPNYSRHLKEFSEGGRGEVLERDGVKRKFRYRFKNPLMRAYVIIRGYQDGLLS
jgi:Cdc6-like AAA superfamily ATPase